MPDQPQSGETFDQLVAQALDSLPEEFGKFMDNVEVVTQDWPTREDLRDGHTPPGSTLFGLYRGVPRTRRGHYHAVLPDRIFIFIGPIVTAMHGNPEAIRTQIRKTVLHELGHHFGMTDEEIRRVGH